MNIKVSKPVPHAVRYGSLRWAVQQRWTYSITASDGMVFINVMANGKLVLVYDATDGEPSKTYRSFSDNYGGDVDIGMPLFYAFRHFVTTIDAAEDDHGELKITKE
jgi:hypothetical protein